MKTARSWLSLAYALALLMAQGMHDHDRRADDAPESRGDCDSAGIHVAGHEVADHGPASASCPSCQLRAQPTLWELPPPTIFAHGLAVTTATAPISTPPGSPLQIRCRAPPRA